MRQLDPTASDIARLRHASDWVQRLHDSDDQTIADEWVRWCGTDAMNLAAFELMQRVWISFPEAVAPASPPTFADVSKHRRRLAALAASVTLLVAAAAWFVFRAPSEQVLETALGDHRIIVLADGSRLDLAPASLVRTHFTLLRRDVRLVRGQAFFEVAHGAVRPFTVYANNLAVTAVGTAFDVVIGASSTAVTVSEGHVAVASSRPETIRADAGQRVTFSQSARKLSVATVNPKVAGAWRDGTLLFIGEPLEDVINAINRYTPQPIAVAPAFQRTRFTGSVSPARVQDWLKALEQIYPVEVVDLGASGVLIRSRAHGI